MAQDNAAHYWSLPRKGPYTSCASYTYTAGISDGLAHIISVNLLHLILSIVAVRRFYCTGSFCVHDLTVTSTGGWLGWHLQLGRDLCHQIYHPVRIEPSSCNTLQLFTHPVFSLCSPTAILVSQFLLDLQEANQAVVRVDPDDLLHSSRDPYDTPSFISSLGAFINPELAVSADDMHDSESHNLSRSEEEESDPRRPSQAARLTSSSSSA